MTRASREEGNKGNMMVQRAKRNGWPYHRQPSPLLPGVGEENNLSLMRES
jgi:hypothetical protein